MTKADLQNFGGSRYGGGGGSGDVKIPKFDVHLPKFWPKISPKANFFLDFTSCSHKGESFPGRKKRENE